jgi:hypothetical protein
MNFGRNEYKRCSRNTAKKKIGLTMMSAASALSCIVPVRSASAVVHGRRCMELATCRNSPARKADATNRAAKFLTLRSTCW